ncbi:MAG: uncharacterized protein A8A55_0410 [Amphiamblys sp. WSBS2006]|nr:MAG: uncharacterized protein A8A55_0410 [Amphiamblys sp. WSBS2006]
MNKRGGRKQFLKIMGTEKNMRRRTEEKNTDDTIEKKMQKIYSKYDAERKKSVRFVLELKNKEDIQRRVFAVLKSGIASNNPLAEKILFTLIQRNKKVHFAECFVSLLCNTLFLLRTEKEKDRRVSLLTAIFKHSANEKKTPEMCFNDDQAPMLRYTLLPRNLDHLDFKNTPSPKKTRADISAILVPFLKEREASCEGSTDTGSLGEVKACLRHAFSFPSPHARK